MIDGAPQVRGSNVPFGLPSKCLLWQRGSEDLMECHSSSKSNGNGNSWRGNGHARRITETLANLHYCSVPCFRRVPRGRNVAKCTHVLHRDARSRYRQIETGTGKLHVFIPLLYGLIGQIDLVGKVYNMRYYMKGHQSDGVQEVLLMSTCI